MGSSRFFLLCFITGLVSFSMNFVAHEARELVVGGKESLWYIPTSPDALNEWAKLERIKIGDVLVFKYDSNMDSVLEVEEGDYTKCNKAKPIKQYTDGKTMVKMDKSGPFFFISGVEGHCEKGEKLEVRVLSHKHSTPSPTLAPKGSPVVSPPPAQIPTESPKSGSGASSVGVVGVATVVMSILACFMVGF
ncbi:early nodulin-like protein 14 [Bidens hawaiensis]|uniref:early nodulin-like protein 14 n=1 Tax=Bidens hawaiensis TaxID=980011 RepID=UPI0040491176